MKSKNRQWFPPSLFWHLRKTLKHEFLNLPQRIQEGYTTLLWDNIVITKANKHSQAKNSWKTSAEELEKLFGDSQRFRDINTNGYYMSPKRTRHGIINGEFKLSKKQDQDSVYYPPTDWVQVTYKGYSKRKGHKGVLNGYQISSEVQKILDYWAEAPKIDKDISSGFNDSFGSLDELFKAKTQPDNVNTLVRINFMSLMEYRFQLEIIQEDLKRHNTSETTKGSMIWNDAYRLLGAVVEEGSKGHKESGKEAKRTEGGIVTPKVNTKPLQALLQKDLTMTDISQQLRQIKKLLLMYRELNFEGIPVSYEVKSTGRLFASNATLQGFNKEVRYAALQSCYAYDLESAHQSILVQLLEAQGANFPELEVMREYVNNKKKARIRLSEELGITVKIVKNILQALTYGTRLSRSPNEAIYKACDGRKAIIEGVVSHPWLIQYRGVFEKAHECLLGDKEAFKNVMGIICKKSSKSARMAHLLQGYERLVIDSLIKRSEKGMVALLLHDAIVFNGKVEIEQLEEFVKHDTGFNLRFSEEAY